MTRRLFALLLLCAAALLGSAGAAAAAEQPFKNADNQACFECHGVQRPATGDADWQVPQGKVDVAAYERSRHGALACTSCHLGFKPGPHTAEQTKGWRQAAKIEACGNCHADLFDMYRGSFHGDLVFAESSEVAPVCADCHEPHNILPPETHEFRASIPGLCARCHEKAYDTYMDNYHGKATFLGNEKTAVCTDCHGGHRILPASDPDSMVNQANLVQTCGACHPGANENFVGFLIHVDPNSPRDSFLVWTFNLLYLLLIAVVFTFGAVHSGLYVYRGIKDGIYFRRHS